MTGTPTIMHDSTKTMHRLELCRVKDRVGELMVRVSVTPQATEQFASDILREALAGAHAKSPQNR
jgi:hypothetical protein